MATFRRGGGLHFPKIGWLNKLPGDLISSKEGLGTGKTVGTVQVFGGYYGEECI